MSGLGRTLAGLELRSARAMSAAQAHYDNLSPPEPDETDDIVSELLCIIREHEEQLGRAERALDGGDIDAARDILIDSGRELAGNAEAVEL